MVLKAKKRNFFKIVCCLSNYKTHELKISHQTNNKGKIKITRSLSSQQTKQSPAFRLNVNYTIVRSKLLERNNTRCGTRYKFVRMYLA